jgi:hypothetical protein
MIRPPALHPTALWRLRGLAALLGAAAALLAAPAQAQLDPALANWGCIGTCGASAADGDITLSPLGNPTYGFLSTAGSTAHNVSPLAISESGGGGQTFTQTNGSAFMSPVFTLAAGQPLEAWFNYVSTDGKGFDDYVWARLVNAADGSTAAWLFTARSTNSSKQNVVPGDVVDKQDFDPDVVLLHYASFDFQTRNTKPGGQPVNWSRLGDSNGTCWRDAAEGCGFSGWLQARVTPGAGSFQLQIGVVNFGDEIYDSGIAFDLPGLVAAPTAPVPEPSTALLLTAGVLGLGARVRSRRRA